MIYNGITFFLIVGYASAIKNNFRNWFIEFDKAYYKVVLSLFNLFIKNYDDFYDWEWYQYCTHKTTKWNTSQS